MNPKRVLQINNIQYTKGPVVYWMNRDIRVRDNAALFYASEYARTHNTELIVVYNLVPGFLGGGMRQHTFKIESLKQVSDHLKEYNIPFFIITKNPTEKALYEFVTKQKTGILVTDFSPLATSKKWLHYQKKYLDIPIVVVDSHNIVPVWITSQKQEYGAYTIRPKIWKLIPEFLEDIPPPHKQKHSHTFKEPDWTNLLHNKSIDTSIKPVTWTHGGETEAHKILNTFIKNRYLRYSTLRNNPLQNAQSGLSPHLHYGTIYAGTIVKRILKHEDKSILDLLHKWKNGAKDTDNAHAFLEELIVRRELADNFCFYNNNYDNPKGFPLWAQKTLKQHKDDSRDFVYTKNQFEKAKTHNPLWNAAQTEMILTGKMHGYMRMYWAKKIFEWTKSPEDAQKIAIYLNDKYELDGRDPNGYAGIAWSIGGVHDRAWFPRKIYGTVRYMAESGCKKKFDTASYIKKWSTPL